MTTRFLFGLYSDRGQQRNASSSSHHALATTCSRWSHPEGGPTRLVGRPNARACAPARSDRAVQVWRRRWRCGRRAPHVSPPGRPRALPSPRRRRRGCRSPRPLWRRWASTDRPAAAGGGRQQGAAPRQLCWRRPPRWQWRRPVAGRPPPRRRPAAGGRASPSRLAPLLSDAHTRTQEGGEGSCSTRASTWWSPWRAAKDTAVPASSTTPPPADA